jgi:hypothetical protein
MHQPAQLIAECGTLISQIVHDLGELYHDAAIISYLENMERVGYHDGIDEPVELQVHFKGVVESGRGIKKNAEALSDLFLSHGLHLDISVLSEAVDDILGFSPHMRSHSALEQSVLPNNQLMAATDKLKIRVQWVVEQATELVGEVLPVPLEARGLEHISYSDVRKNPQAIAQLAFTLFETHLRKRIGAGPELYGENLINRAYGGNGDLSYGAVQSERVGTRNLLSGAYAVFRNPRMHRSIEENEQMAVKLLALVDLLIWIVDESEDKAL